MDPLQHGIPAIQDTVTLRWVTLPGIETPGFHPEQLCPHRQFWQSHPDAPWNEVWSDSPAFWRDLDDRWREVDDADPAAPWNRPELSRNPADYQDRDGSSLLWVAPEVIPLVKIDKPADTATHTSEPILVWFEDRVERQWQSVPIPAAELRSAARTALRAAWDSLPAYIRGPFQDKFNTANSLLDAGDDEAAQALIEYAEAPMAYSVEQVAVFSAVKAQMTAGIAGLPN